MYKTVGLVIYLCVSIAISKV